MGPFLLLESLRSHYHDVSAINDVMMITRALGSPRLLSSEGSVIYEKSVIFPDHLPPVPWHSAVAARASLPTAVNPNRVRIRRDYPVPRRPNPAAIPDPFAAHPYIA